ncbi:MAG: hypothetical protein DMF84_26755 [Acidobacteria bacterium]|nr:MAG: hypothetical protein DMF84_26755 [Acidobacteriota bacterium]
MGTTGHNRERRRQQEQNYLHQFARRVDQTNTVQAAAAVAHANLPQTIGRRRHTNLIPLV